MYKEPGYSIKSKAAPLLKVLEKDARPGTKARCNAKLKAMALAAPENTSPDHFSSVILYADRITEKFGSWLQDSLEKNGDLIQVYSGLGHASRFYDENNRILEKHSVSGDRHSSYYEVYREDNAVSLFPFPGEEHDQVIELVKMRTGLSPSPGKAVFHPARSVCIEKEKSDALHLHVLLVNLSSKNDPAENLMNRPVLPYLGSICRWDSGPANCERLDTVIIDRDDNIKTCWNGRPVGKVGMPYLKIAETLGHIRLENEAKKGCRNCNRDKSCSKCIFPEPLSAGEYCYLKQYTNTDRVTKLIDNLNLVKEV